MYSTQRTIKKEDLDEFNETVCKLQKYIKQQIQSNSGKTKVIFIGITGSGKSSVSCCLAGKDLKIQKDKGNEIALFGKGVQSGLTSVTREPSIIPENDFNILYCDCPGFEDTNGFFQEIINAFANDYLFENYSGKENLFKIFLVAAYDEIISSRGEKMVKSLNRLEEMFINEENWQDGVGFIFTKTKNKTVDNIVDLLNNRPPKQLIKWIRFLETHQDNVFFFPKPSKKKLGTQYDFEDRERLLEFIQLNPLVNPKHKIALSDIAMLKMKEIRSIHLNNVYNKVQALCNKINEQFQNETGSNEIKHWIDLMHALIKRNVKTAKEFGDVINEIIPNSQKYKDDIKGLEEFEIFDEFLDKVLYKVEDTSCLNDVIQAWCHQCIYGLVQSHTRAVESESHKKEIERQKQLITEKDRINNEYMQKIREMQEAMQKKEEQNMQRLEQQRIESQKSYDQQMKHISEMIEKAQNERRNCSGDSEKEKLLECKLSEMIDKIQKMEEMHKQETEGLKKSLEEHKLKMEELSKPKPKRTFFEFVSGGIKKFFGLFK